VASRYDFNPVRRVFKVYYIPLPRGEDGGFNFLYTAQENPCASDFKKLQIKLSEVLNPLSRISLADVLRNRLEVEFIGQRDPKKYALCPVRFKVEGEDLLN
jgi:hypothetical protein